MRGTPGNSSAMRGELAILRAEVVAPLADAMRLVDGEQRDLDVREHLQEARRRQPLGRDIEQVELAVRERAPDGRGVFRRSATN